MRDERERAWCGPHAVDEGYGYVLVTVPGIPKRLHGAAGFASQRFRDEAQAIVRWAASAAMASDPRTSEHAERVCWVQWDALVTAPRQMLIRAWYPTSF